MVLFIYFYFYEINIICMKFDVNDDYVILWSLILMVFFWIVEMMFDVFYVMSVWELGGGD